MTQDTTKILNNFVISSERKQATQAGSLQGNVYVSENTNNVKKKGSPVVGQYEPLQSKSTAAQGCLSSIEERQT